MMAYSLDKLYESNEIVCRYLCNGLGEINVPECESPHSPDALPPQARELYDTELNKPHGGRKYIMQIGRAYGVAACYLEYNSDLAEMARSIGKEQLAAMIDKYDHGDHLVEESLKEVKAARNLLALSVYLVAENIRYRLMYLYGFEICKMFVGRNTDPCGVELLCFVPLEKATFAQRVFKELDDHFYQLVELNAKMLLRVVK